RGADRHSGVSDPRRGRLLPPQRGEVQRRLAPGWNDARRAPGARGLPPIRCLARRRGLSRSAAEAAGGKGRHAHGRGSVAEAEGQIRDPSIRGEEGTDLDRKAEEEAEGEGPGEKVHAGEQIEGPVGPEFV